MSAKYWDGEHWIELAAGERGPQGPTGNGIQTIILNADYTLTITYTNGGSYTTPPIRGEQGPQGVQGPTGQTGNGISSIVLNEDYTLTINYTNGGSYTTPTPIRGEQGPQGPQGQSGQRGESGYSPAVTITPIAGGTRIKITDEAHPSGQSFDVLNGSGSGDMTTAVYDSDGKIAQSGGIAQYFAKFDGMLSKVTTFNSDGSITETASTFKKITTFNSDGSITEALKKTDNTLIATKVTTFNADGSISETVTEA